MMSLLVLDLLPSQTFFIFLALCVALFVIVLIVTVLCLKIHQAGVRKRALHKAFKVTEGIGGNNISCLHGEELAPALKNKQIAFANFPLSEGSETLYTPPEDGSEPSLFVAGKTLIMAVPLENFNEKTQENLGRISDGYNSALKLLFTRSAIYSPLLLVVANNASEASRVKNNSAKVVIGISGLIKEMLRLSRNASPYDAGETLNALYSVFPDIRLLLKEDRECDPRIEKGKKIIDRKDGSFPYNPKEDGDTIYTFHLYEGRQLQKPRKEQ
jgi:hypothetical protein